jgi:hypothetical protein
MSSQTAMTLMSVVEFALWAVLGFLFWTKKLQRRFPAMGTYVALHVASIPVLVVLFHGQAQHWFNDYCFAMYFFTYWAVFIASAMILYFVCLEVFSAALSAFSGLMKFGIVVFRWAILASVIVTFSSISFAHKGLMLIPDIANALMRSVSILELCLLGFLCLSMNALRLPARDMAFGIALGFGVMSANDFIQSLFISIHSSLTAPWQFVYEAMILVAIGTWTTYCALPEPARRPVVMPANSTIYRWNEIASALGHTGTQVAVQQPANGFFLTDVERVVEKVLARNLKDRESES